ncbi:MAG: DUF106 domain-containing protein [Candidatus Diapherotrites archaeon]|nr:DUF106 domain-containing protein [Candidatus Diapherotrites archaeon]
MTFFGIEVLNYNAFYMVSAIAIAVTIVSILLNKKFVDQERMKAMQEKSRNHQKEMDAALKSKDKAKISEMEKAQQEIMREFAEVMKGSMSYMIVILIAIFPLFMFMGSMYHPFADLQAGQTLSLGDVTIRAVDFVKEEGKAEQEEQVPTRVMLEAVQGNETQSFALAVNESKDVFNTRVLVKSITQNSDPKANVGAETLMLRLPFSFPLVGFEFGWLPLYILVGFIFGITGNKLTANIKFGVKK